MPDTSTAFNITSVATKLVFTAQPTTTPAGSAMAPAVKVTAEDSLGNTVVGFTGNVAVAIYDNPGLGILSGTKTQPATAGVATFSNLSINRVGNGYTLIATASGLVDFSTLFNIIPGAPAQLVFTVVSNTPAGTVISPPVQVTVEDAQGNTVTGYSGSVTMAIGTNPNPPPGKPTLSGTTAQPVSSGVATFSDLSIDLPGNGYTLQASSGALTSFSALFNIF